MMALLYENVLAHQDSWIEYLEDPERERSSPVRSHAQIAIFFVSVGIFLSIAKNCVSCILWIDPKYSRQQALSRMKTRHSEEKDLSRGDMAAMRQGHSIVFDHESCRLLLLSPHCVWYVAGFLRFS